MNVRHFWECLTSLNVRRRAAVTTNRRRGEQHQLFLEVADPVVTTAYNARPGMSRDQVRDLLIREHDRQARR